jgi:hypothetical protein
MQVRPHTVTGSIAGRATIYRDFPRRISPKKGGKRAVALKRDPTSDGLCSREVNGLF